MLKYTKEATTKGGRRTWRVTYELVRGPEPKGKRAAAGRAKETKQTAPAAAAAPSKAGKKARGSRKRRKGNQNQLDLF